MTYEFFEKLKEWQSTGKRHVRIELGGIGAKPGEVWVWAYDYYQSTGVTVTEDNFDELDVIIRAQRLDELIAQAQKRTAQAEEAQKEVENARRDAVLGV